MVPLRREYLLRHKYFDDRCDHCRRALSQFRTGRKAVLFGDSPGGQCPNFLGHPFIDGPHENLHISRNLCKVLKRDFPLIRRSEFCSEIHERNVLQTHRLNEAAWPSIRNANGHRRLWPSYPTFTEMLDMSRRGYNPPENYVYPTGSTCRVTAKEVNSEPLLAKRIVARYIIGIRSDQEVPMGFHGYFRYRQGFLILTNRWSLPIGLARFLLSRWTLQPSSLWLERPGSLKQCLRAIPFRMFHSSRSVAYLHSVSEWSSGQEGYPSSASGGSRSLRRFSEFLSSRATSPGR